MRVSVTAVDSLRYLLSTDKSTDEIVAEMRGEVEPTPAMQAGRAFHSILEYPPSDELETVEREGHTFQFALDSQIALPSIRELKTEFPIRVSGLDVTLVGKVDSLSGNRIDDHKLTSSFNADKYAQAFQWRAYLHIFGATAFRYNVFTGSQLKDGTWRIRALDSLDFYAYPGLESDVANGLGEFVDFCKFFLPERLQEAAA